MPRPPSRSAAFTSSAELVDEVANNDPVFAGVDD